MHENSLWIEKYRPKNFDEMQGNKPIIERIKAMVEKKNLNNIILAGPPGTGKTSIIYVAARSLYGENFHQYILELNASHDRGIDVVRTKIKDFAKILALNNMHKVIILDEADALTKDAQHALRRTMEVYSSTTRFCLIANYPSKIIDPIKSRCVTFYFKPLEKEQMEAIIGNIAENEGLKINQDAMGLLCSIADGDARKAQNILQSSSILSKNITLSLINQVSSTAKPKDIKEILNFAINKNFIKARSLLLETMLKQGLSGLDAIKGLHEEILSMDIPDEKKAIMIEKCAEIEFRLVEGSDEYIQLEALLASFALIKNDQNEH